MKREINSKSLILGLSLVVGLFILGLFIFKGFKTFSDKDRVVTVKGLAEMNMTATSATITIHFSNSSDDLQQAIRQTESKKKAIMDHLAQRGYSSGSITVENVEVVDREKYYDTTWRNGQEVVIKIDRYTISQALHLQTTEVATTEDEASKIKLELISKELTSSVRTSYLFPDLNSIKPQLIAESTKNARVAGEQFANDSQAKLGKIKTASQGQITIAGRYYYDEEESNTPQEPYLQKARVVSTIVFFLE